MNENMDIPDGLLRQRRNVFIFSIGILLYVFGGGHIENISTISGSIKLENPEVALYFAVIGFFYSIWRYWIYSDRVLANLRYEYISTMINFKPFNDLAKSLQGPQHVAHLINLSPVITDNDGKYQLDFSRKLTKGGGHSSVSGQKAVDVSASTIKLIKIRLWIYVLARKRIFSDYLLPYILASFALATLVFYVA